MIASDILKTAAAEMDDRAKTYDQPQGERSMAKTVATYNALTGQTLTELDGWKFMACLKLARSEQGDHRPDNYIDGAAYMALAGESASTGNEAGREPLSSPQEHQSFNTNTGGWHHHRQPGRARALRSSGKMSEKTITELVKNSELFSGTTRLTANKTDTVISMGMAITGFVVTDPVTNDKFTVDLGQVNKISVPEVAKK